MKNDIKTTIGESMVMITGVSFTINNFLEWLSESYPLLIGLLATIIYRYMEMKWKRDRANILLKQELELKKQKDKAESKRVQEKHDLEMKVLKQKLL